MTETAAFDDTGGLVFIFLIGLSATIGVILTNLYGITGPGAVPLVFGAMVGLPILVSVLVFCAVINPFGAREILFGVENDS